MVCEETNSNPAADECTLEQFKWWGEKKEWGWGREEESKAATGISNGDRRHWCHQWSPAPPLPPIKWINPKNA